eukprot:TRINITY_DN2188_c0_g1_i2.p1 TRINITY_DN2188_c0_g1~~TRINITY_DN2188_c0_g1_i2.p1  ORF type:complete len:103 (+),score=9.57 TRINITY_DN2188_c0_g1_i2:399-707(+)
MKNVFSLSLALCLVLQGCQIFSKISLNFWLQDEIDKIVHILFTVFTQSVVKVIAHLHLCSIQCNARNFHQFLHGNVRMFVSFFCVGNHLIYEANTEGLLSIE